MKIIPDKERFGKVHVVCGVHMCVHGDTGSR
jgi:hypothetical protein